MRQRKVRSRIRNWFANPKYVVILFLFFFVIMVGDVFSYNEENLDSVNTESTMSLFRPVFASESGISFLEEEGGISVYTNVDQILDISRVRSVFKTIEQETSNYIIGSLALTDLPESEDVHGYVHKDGWIVVYYLKNEPVAKMIDWTSSSTGQLTKTKLQLGIETVGNNLGVMISEMEYYHFQYPYAGKLMIIIEYDEVDGADSFEFKIPNDYMISEISWSHYGPSHSTEFLFNGVRVSRIYYSSTSYNVRYDVLVVSKDTFHTISVDYSGSVALVLLYQEP